jgi:hypothetical protein
VHKANRDLNVESLRELNMLQFFLCGFKSFNILSDC